MKWINLPFIIILTGCQISSEPGLENTYVIITFDDGHESIYNKALPIMNEFGIRATNVINTGEVGENDELTWQQIEELEFEHGWETAGHTLHHITLTTTPLEIVEYEIYQDMLNLREHGLSHDTFALPSGKATEEHYEIILQYYQNVRSSLNSFTFSPLDRTSLGYYVYLSGYTSEKAQLRILQAIQKKECLVIIGFHRIMEEDDGYPTNCKPADFYDIMKFLYDNNLEVITIKEACELL